ncbi:MAG: helix-turn-helix domain-containing protein [Solirubrobacterales bacterium]
MGNEKGPQATGDSRAFGRNLVRLRKRAGLSQEGAADRAGLHRTHVAMIEAGQRLPRLDTIVKLGGAVGVKPCELLAGLAWEFEAPKEGSK